MTLSALFIAADVAMIALWGYFAYLRKPHISLRAMSMIIVGIVAIMVECFPNVECGVATSYYLLFAGLLHYLSNRKGKSDILLFVTYASTIIPIAILPYVIEDSPYEVMTKSFKYNNEKSLANLIDVSILPRFEMDTVYIEDNNSEPKLITARFSYRGNYDLAQYQMNVNLVKQLYTRHMHKTCLNQKKNVYLASEVSENADCRTFYSAAIDLYDSGFSVTYGEYTDRIDPVHIGYLSQLFGDVPDYTSIFRHNVHTWDKVDGEEVILLETPLTREDFERLKVVCSGDKSWSMKNRQDTTDLIFQNDINERTSQITVFTMLPDQMGGCEAIHIKSVREIMTSQL